MSLQHKINLTKWMSVVTSCLFLLSACRAPKKSPREKYADRLVSAGLRETGMGSLWFAAAEKSLNQPLSITIPYKETGYFAADKPGAEGYIFPARQGEQLSVAISIIPVNGSLLFAELWEAGENGKPRLLEAVDTTTLAFQYEIEKNGKYLIRLQPELLRGIEYTLTIIAGPSLAFPVRAIDSPHIKSFWGVPRDGGRRSHEGIDIFAKKRTPVIAIADGRITRAGENKLGGKVISMRPKGKKYSLYYAHLDEQIARDGQRVHKGDVLGLVGNTGNAITTPPHLHFGIYATSGAVDPLPFVDTDRPKPKEITASTFRLNKYVHNNSAANMYATPFADVENFIKLDANNLLYISAATGNWYKVTCPDGSEGFVNSSSITSQPLRKQTIQETTRLFDLPDSTAAAKKILAKGDSVSVLGTYNNYYFIEDDKTKGWLKK
jgi:murein DD-endopeptidase MepM/ murein hydrolase activator NlpD